MFTPRQAALYRFIQDHQRETGRTPSFAEMCTALNVASKSSVHRLICGMQERGILYRKPHVARSIVLDPKMAPDRIRERAAQLLPKLKEPGVGELYVRARAEKPPRALCYGVGIRPDRTW